MDPRTWARDDLRRHVAGTQVMMRSSDGSELPVPAWLGDAAARVGTLTTSESIEAVHPDDRGLIIDTFVAALGEPGRPASFRCRILLDGRWQHNDIVWLNLLDHPDVGGVVLTNVEVAGPPIDGVEKQAEGESRPTNWMILQLGQVGTILGTRGRVAEILGYEPHELVGHMATEFLHPDTMASAAVNWIELMQNPERTRTSRRRWVRKDGTAVWLEISYLVHDDGTVEGLAVDVDDRVAHERALAASRAEVAALAADFRLLADEVPAGVFRCDADGRVRFHNARWTELFPAATGDARLHDVVAADDRPALDELLAGVTRSAGSGTATVEVGAADGSRVLAIRCRAVSDPEGGHRVVGSVADVTATVQLRHQASHDPLTGLPNRAAIEARLGEAVAVDPNHTLVVFIDLDGFKQVNDEHGHDAGDTVLVEVARRLARGVRPDDVVGRYGGDEFVVVCGGMGDASDAGITDRLERALAGPIDFAGGTWQPRASLGTARAEPGLDVAALLRRADLAMYEVKQGRSAVGA